MAWCRRLPVERGRELHDLIPGSQFRVVPRTGHLLQLDAPATVVTMLADFLRS